MRVAASRIQTLHDLISQGPNDPGDGHLATLLSYGKEENSYGYESTIPQQFTMKVLYPPSGNGMCDT